MPGPWSPGGSGGSWATVPWALPQQAWRWACGHPCCPCAPAPRLCQGGLWGLPGSSKDRSASKVVAKGPKRGRWTMRAALWESAAVFPRMERLNTYFEAKKQIQMPRLRSSNFCCTQELKK